MEHGKLFACIFFFTLTWKFYSSSIINDKLIVNKVERTVDISTQLAKVTLDITLENAGSDSCKSFLIGVDSKLANHLAYASASVSIFHCSGIIHDTCPRSGPRQYQNSSLILLLEILLLEILDRAHFESLFSIISRFHV